MTLAVNELQKAIYTRLTSQIPATPIYNHVPQGSSFPYIIIGEKTTLAWRDKIRDGQEVTITLHIWSNAAGDKECATIMGSIYSALDRQEANITPSGYTLVSIESDYTQLMADTGDEGEPDHYYHGIMRFRALIH